MRSDEKHELWSVLAAGVYAEEELPSDNNRLVQKIREIRYFLSQVQEEMDGYFKVAPKVKRYFDLLNSEKENRRNPKYVEDAFTGELVLESDLVKSTFDFDKVKVTRFRGQ